MAIKLSKKNLCVNQIVGQKTEKIVVEGDEIVPDIKPDILSVVSTNGNICIYKKEVQDGKVKIEGGINAYVIYIADDEKSSIRALSANLEFSRIIDIKECKENMQLECKSQLSNMDCRILNGRKISLRAIMDMSVVLYSKENIEYIDKIEDIKDIQLLNKNITINSLVGTGITKVYAKDTITIDNVDNLSEIMKVNISVENRESKISYNKVLAKADTVMKIMYLTEDNRINTSSTTIPIMGFIDMQDVSEDDICDLNYEIKNILVKPNNVEEHSVYVEAEIEILGFVYKRQTIDMIEDLYSKTIELTYSQKSVKLMSERTSTNETYSMRKQERIEEMAQSKIFDVEVKPVIVSSRVEEGKITYKGDVNLTFIFARADSSSIGVKNVIEPFEFEVSASQVSSRDKIDTNIEISKKDFVVMPDSSIDIKIDFNFSINIVKESNINIIENIKEEEGVSKEAFSIIIYYAKLGDTLWNIAKRFGSTVEEIASINNIEDADRIMQGQQLFIPR